MAARAVGPAEEVVIAYRDAFRPRRRARKRPKVEPVTAGHAASANGAGVDAARIDRGRIDKGTDVADAVAPRDAELTAQGDGLSSRIHAATGSGEKSGRGPEIGP